MLSRPAPAIAAFLSTAVLAVAASSAVSGAAGVPRLPAGARAGTTVTIALKLPAGSRPLTLVLSRDARRSLDDVVLGTLKVPSTKQRTVLARRQVRVPSTTAPETYRLLGCSSAKRCRTLIATFKVTGAAGPGGPTAPTTTSPASSVPASTPVPAPTPPAPASPPVNTTPDTSTTPTTTTTPTTPAPPPPTGLQIAPNPIVLGDLGRSASNDEITAATRLVTVTNLGPGTAPPLTMQTVARQGETIVTSNVVGESFDGKPACFEGLALADGSACGVRISWRAGFNAPASGMTGSFTIRDRNDGTTVTASAPMSAGYVSRAFFAAGGGISGSPVLGYAQNGEVTITNTGDIAGGFDIEFAGPDAASYNRRVGFGTCEALGSDGLAKDASCTIGIQFCGGVAKTYTADLVVHAGGITGPVTDRLAVGKAVPAGSPGNDKNC